MTWEVHLQVPNGGCEMVYEVEARTEIEAVAMALAEYPSLYLLYSRAQEGSAP
jgi:hypothetical protein